MQVSTRHVVNRWREAVEARTAVRGDLFYVAPGTTAIKVAGRTVTPSDNADGLTPFSPLATIDELFTKITTGEGDVGCLMKDGTYNLTANVSTTKRDFTLMGAPGLNPRAVSVAGIDGGHAMELKGGNVHLIGFEIAGASDAHACCVLNGRYSLSEDMVYTSKAPDTEVAAYGLILACLAAHASGDKSDASFVRVIGGEIDYCARGLYVDNPTNSAFGGPTNNRIIGVVFGKNTTHDIDQASDADINAWLFEKCKFRGPLPAGPSSAGKFVRFPNGANANTEVNAMIGCEFSDADVTSTGDVSLTGVNLIGCVDGTNA